MSEFDFTSALRSFGRQTVTDESNKAKEAAQKDEELKRQAARQAAVQRSVQASQENREAVQEATAKATAGIVNAGAKGAQAVSGYAEGVMSRLDPNRKIGPNEQFEIDQQTMPPGEFAMKYGRDAELARYFGAQDINPSASRRVANREDDRTLGQKYIDRSLAAGGAAVSMTADTAGAVIRTGGALPGADALRNVPGANRIFNETANIVSDSGGVVSEFLNSGTSNFAKNAPGLKDQTAAARLADSAFELEQSNGGIKEQFKRIGRDTVISATAYGDNPGAVDGVVAAAVGSMAPSLLAAGGVRSLTTGILNQLGVKGITKAGVETLATAATVGAMEGAGAYSQVRNEILNMDPQDLMKESELYKELTDNGLSHEKAVTEVAEQAAMSAQIMTTLVASGISIPFAGFEGGFFTRSGRKFLLELGGEELASASKEVIAETLKNAPKAAIQGARNRAGTTLFQAGQDIAGQTIEESAQNAVATFAGNVAIGEYADQSRQMSQDVGNALVEGAIGGIGATAIMQSKDAPALIKDYAKQVTNLALGVGKEIGKPITKGKARKLNEIKIQELASSIEGRFNQASEIVSAIERMDAGEPVTPEAREALEKARVELAPHIAAFQDTGSPEYLERTKLFKEDIVSGSKLKTILNVARRLQLADGNKYKEGSKQAESASNFLLDELGRINTIIEELQIGAQKTQAAEGTQRTEEEEAQATAQAKARAAEFTENMAETPVFAEAIQKASEIVNEESAKSVEAGGPVIPVKSLTELLLNPVGINPERITPEVEAAMSPEGKKVAAVVRAIQSPEHAERKDPLAGNRANTREGTRNEIFFQSKKVKNKEVASFNNMMSQMLLGAVRYARRADTTSEITVQDTQGAEVSPIDVFEDFKALVQNQANRYAAATDSYNFSLANPGEKSTRTFDSKKQGRNEFKKDGGSIWINAHPNKDGNYDSMQTYRYIAEEFNTGVRALNALIEQFPDIYKGQKLQEVPLPVVPKSTKSASNAAASPKPQENQKPETPQGQQTQPTQVVGDTNVGDNTGVDSDPVLSNKMSFKDLFNGGSETTFADSIQYLLSLNTLDALQQQVLNMVTASGFARANPNTIVRKATAAENAKAKNKHGWWDPQANEIVLFVEEASNLLHEMVHAVTLEALFKNLGQAHIKKAAGKELSQLEQAAYNLNMAALAFMEEKPLNAEVAAVQGLMRALVDPTKPIAQQDRGMARAISEYMAYGLTNNQVKKQLVAKKTGKTEISKETDLVDAIANVARVFLKELGKFVGNKTKRVDETNLRDALDDLYFNTKALALDGQTTVLKAREVQRAKAKDVKTPKPEKEPTTKRSSAKYQVETEDAGSFELTIIRLPDGSAALLGPDIKVDFNPKFVGQKTDQELMAYQFEPLGFVQATEINKAKAEPAAKTKPAPVREPVTEPVEAQAEVSSTAAAAVEETDTTRREEQTEDDGPEQIAPAQEADDLTDQIAQGLLKIIQAAADKAVPPTPATPAVAATTPTPAASTADAVAPAVAEAASATPAKTPITNRETKKLKARYDDLVKKVNNLTKTEATRTEAGEPAANLEKLRANLKKAIQERDDLAVELNIAKPETPVEPTLKPTIQEVVQKAVEPAKAYVPSAKEINSMLSDLKSEIDSFETSLKALNDDLESIYNNQFKKSAFYKDVPLTLPQFKAIAKGDTKSAPYKAGMIKIEAYNSLEKTPETDLSEKFKDVLDQAADVADQMPRLITAFETARKAYEYELKAADRKAETISSLVVEEAATEETKPQPVVVPSNAVFVPAPVEQIINQAVIEPETTPVVEEVITEEVDTGLPTNWKPTYEPGSNLFGSTKEGSFISKILNNLKPILQPGDTFDRLLRHVAPSLWYKVTPEMQTQANAVRRDAQAIAKGMQERLANQLTTLKAKNGNLLLNEMKKFVEGQTNFNPARSSQYRILAWLDAQSIKNGKPQFDTHLLMLALMATADYVMQNQDIRGVYKLEDVMKHLGLSDPSKITPEMFRMVNMGLPGVLVKDDLAKHIRQFMGAETNDKVSTSQTDGIFQALAHEILEYLGSQPADNTDKNYWVRENKINVYGRTVTVFSFGKPKGWLEGAGTNLLKDILTSKSSDMHKYSVGQKWGSEDVAKRLKRNRTIKVSPKQRRAIQKQQDVPFYWSKDFWEMYTALIDANGIDSPTMRYMLGFKSIKDTEFFNEMDRQAVQGKNASITYGFMNAKRQMDQIRAYAEKNNIDPWDVPIYYRIAIGENTRFNMEGFNPQQNKFAREMFSPTRHTVDLTDPKAVTRLYAAISQSLGIKVENNGFVAAAAQAKEKLAGDYAEIMKALETGNLSDPKTRRLLVDEINRIGLEEDAFTLKGLWTAKKLKEAIAKGDTEFETDMYMELDGKTNGPISAAIQYFTGSYSPEILANWRRGGYFLSNAFQDTDELTYYQYRNNIQTSKELTPEPNRSNADFYGRVAELTSTSLLFVQKNLSKEGGLFADALSPDQVKFAKRAFERTMGLLSYDQNYTVGRNPETGLLEVRIKRGATKSPITKNIYGSGLRAISIGLTGDLFGEVYSDLTKVGRGDKEALAKLRVLAAHLDELMTYDVIYDEFYQTPQSITQHRAEGPSLKALLQNDNPSKELLAKFQFSADQFEQLSTNIQAFYGTAFKNALNTAVDPSVARLNKDLIKGSQIHGKLYKRIVDKALKDKHAELVAAGVILQTEELSASARRDVLEAYRDLSPIIDNGVTAFSVAGSDTETGTDVARRIFGQKEYNKKAKKKGNPEIPVEREFNSYSRTLFGKEIDSRRPTIEPPSVEILPLNTQTNSDVRMEIETWTNTNYPGNALAVHDGNNHATTDLEQASLVMNEAIAVAWHTNTLRPILEAYDRALSFVSKQFSEDGNFDDATGKLINNLQIKRNELLIDVLTRDARIAAEKKIYTSFQGVPGGERAFVQGGLRFNSDKELADFLNEETARIFNELIREDRSTGPKAGSILNFDKMMEVASVLDSGNPMEPAKALYEGAAVFDFLEELKAGFTNSDDVKTLDAIVQSEAFKFMLSKGLRVQTALRHSDATQQQTQEARMAYMLNGAPGGVYQFHDNTVFMFEPNTQVALHELLHSATVHQIFTYYEDPSKLSETQKAAVKALEVLLDKFMLTLPAMFTADGRLSPEDAISETPAIATLIELYTQPEYTSWPRSKALAVAEFVTYGLTNPELHALLKSKTIKVDAKTKQALLPKISLEGLNIIRMMKNIIKKMFRLPAVKQENQETNETSTIVDNLMHHTKILMQEPAEPVSWQGAAKIQGMASTASNPDISRKLDLQNKIATQVSEFLKARRRGDSEAVTRARRASNQAAYTKAKNDANDALNTMAAAGFTVKGPQDILLFQTIHAVVAADMKMDKVALQELQLVYNAVIEKLGTDSFEKFGPQGVTGQLQSTRMYAAVLGQSFFDVTGAREFLPPRGPAGVERLASFIALAQTSPEMRQILSEMDLSSLNLNTSINTKGGLDGLLGSFGENMMNRMTGRILEETGSQSSPVNETLDVLTDMLLDYDTQAATSFETDVSTNLMSINAALKQGISSAATSISDSLQRSASNAESEVSQTIQNLAAAFVDILDEKRAAVRADMTTSLLNKDNIWEPVRNLFAEMRAMSEDTAAVLRLVKKAKNMIARVRNEYIENVPKIIRESFGPEFAALRSDEKQQIMQTLFVGLGKTDFAAVSKIVGSRSALKYFGTDKAAKDALQSEIRQLKKSLGTRIEAMGLPKAVEAAYAKKAEQLADYMVNKKIGSNTLTSAVSILNLHNEDGHSITEAEYQELQTVLKARQNEKGQYTDKTRQLIDTIDALVSMEAIARLDDSVHNNMAKFIGSNQKAVLAAIDYQIELHRQESDKVDLNSAAALNGIKGAFLTNSQHKHSVIVADAASEKSLKERGYTRVRSFNGPAQKFDPDANKKAYYFSAHNSLATYNQGVIQTVQDTYFGIDPRTGLMIGAETTGNMVTGNPMKLLNRRLKAHKGQQFEDGVIPRFSSTGALVAFQETVASDVFTLLNQTNDYADSLGRWAGRIQEEKASHGLNYELIDAAKAMYDKDVKAGKKSEYAAFGREPKEGGSRDLKDTGDWDLNLKETDDWDSGDGTAWDFTDDLLNDPIWMESYLLMPRDAREYAEKVFGGPMMIRRDMINNTFGFRSASVGDIFTGKTRMSPEMTEAIKGVFMATPFLGKDAYKYLTMTEEALQSLVSGVKHIIVVKSGVVMIANTVSNVFQLATREVPLSYIAQRTRSKWAELEQYKKNEDLKIKLRFDYLSSKSNSERANIQARLDSINEVNEKMTIWPLIQANQFTTISEGLTDSDTAIFNKGFGDWIERKAGELPGPLSTVARYALISKDTALYQGLAKGVQYGDFIAKAIYYDFLTEERGVNTEAAMLKIDQEFINYDLNDSRLRSYLESVGITWFMNFKIRSLKVAIDMIRNNPATALLMLGTGGMFGVGSPITDNLVSVTADGRLGYAIGPGMLDAAWNLNFWNQISGNG